MNRKQPVKDIMTANVITVQPNDVMEKVQEIFQTHHIHHIPVAEATGKIAGIISRSDYLRLTHGFTLFKTKQSELYNHAVMRSLLVGDVMVSQLITLHPDDTVATAADLFRLNLFHALPVVDHQKQLVGIVTPYDLLNFAFDEPPLLE